MRALLSSRKKWNKPECILLMNKQYFPQMANDHDIELKSTFQSSLALPLQTETLQKKPKIHASEYKEISNDGICTAEQLVYQSVVALESMNEANLRKTFYMHLEICVKSCLNDVFVRTLSLLDKPKHHFVGTMRLIGALLTLAQASKDAEFIEWAVKGVNMKLEHSNLREDGDVRCINAVVDLVLEHRDVSLLTDAFRCRTLPVWLLDQKQSRTARKIAICIANGWNCAQQIECLNFILDKLNAQNASTSHSWHRLFQYMPSITRCKQVWETIIRTRYADSKDSDAIFLVLLNNLFHGLHLKACSTAVRTLVLVLQEHQKYVLLRRAAASNLKTVARACHLFHESHKQNLRLLLVLVIGFQEPASLTSRFLTASFKYVTPQSRILHEFMIQFFRQLFLKNPGLFEARLEQIEILRREAGLHVIGTIPDADFQNAKWPCVNAILTCKETLPISTDCSQKATGLVNLGNTCFMNSIIQTLYRNRCFWNYIMKHDHDGDYREIHNSLRYAFACIDYSARPAIKLVALHRSLPPSFRNFRQHDASEFLSFLIDAVDRHIHCDAMIKSVEPDFCFGGLHEREIRCHSCGRISAHVEPFLELLLDINRPTINQNHPVELRSLIANYYEPIELKGETAYHCLTCGDKQAATQTTTITQVPRNLCVCIKRNGPTGLEKVVEPIKFQQTLKLADEIYLLWSIVVHSGSDVDSGHYYAYSRDSAVLIAMIRKSLRETPTIDVEELCNAEPFLLLNDEDASQLQTFNAVHSLLDGKHNSCDTAYLLYFARLSADDNIGERVPFPLAFKEVIDFENSAYYACNNHKDTSMQFSHKKIISSSTFAESLPQNYIDPDL